MNYEEYEKQCEEIRNHNESYLKAFKEELNGKGFKEKTINNHIENVRFFINEFLLYEDAVPMTAGISHVGSFLGDYFIRKCMWSTPGNIKTTAASIKKFYKCMLDNNEIERADYDHLCDVIKSDMDDWQESCRKYNEIEEDSMPEFWDDGDDEEGYFSDDDSTLGIFAKMLKGSFESMYGGMTEQEIRDTYYTGKNPKLKKILSTYSTSDLRVIARNLGVENASSQKKKEAINAIETVINDSDAVRELLMKLTDQEWDVLCQALGDTIDYNPSNYQQINHLLDLGLIIIDETDSYYASDELEKSMLKYNADKFDADRDWYKQNADFVRACVHLYGVIDRTKLLEIYSDITTDSEYDFEGGYEIVVELLDDTLTRDENLFINNNIISDRLLIREIGDPDDFVLRYDFQQRDNLYELQGDKPYYTPDVDTFYEFVDKNYRFQTNNGEEYSEKISRMMSTNTAVGRALLDYVSCHFDLNVSPEDAIADLAEYIAKLNDIEFFQKKVMWDDDIEFSTSDMVHLKEMITDYISTEHFLNTLREYKQQGRWWFNRSMLG